VECKVSLADGSSHGIDERPNNLSVSIKIQKEFAISSFAFGLPAVGQSAMYNKKHYILFSTDDKRKYDM
jgi:hypothetical protein